MAKKLTYVDLNFIEAYNRKIIRSIDEVRLLLLERGDDKLIKYYNDLMCQTVLALGDIKSIIDNYLKEE